MKLSELPTDIKEELIMLYEAMADPVKEGIEDFEIPVSTLKLADIDWDILQFPDQSVPTSEPGDIMTLGGNLWTSTGRLFSAKEAGWESVKVYDVDEVLLSFFGPSQTKLPLISESKPDPMRSYWKLPDFTIKGNWLYDKNKRHIGYAALRAMDKPKGVELSDITLLPKYQSKGHGKAFIQQLQAETVKRNVYLGLTPSDFFGASHKAKLIGFYEHLGFKATKNRSLSVDMVFQPPKQRDAELAVS